MTRLVGEPSPADRRRARTNERLALRRHLQELQEEGRLIESIMADPFELPLVRQEVDRLRDRAAGLRKELERAEEEISDLVDRNLELVQMLRKAGVLVPEVSE